MPYRYCQDCGYKNVYEGTTPPKFCGGCGKGEGQAAAASAPAAAPAVVDDTEREDTTLEDVEAAPGKIEMVVVMPQDRRRETIGDLRGQPRSTGLTRRPKDKSVTRKKVFDVIASETSSARQAPK